jgi:hypothetical protein
MKSLSPGDIKDIAIIGAVIATIGAAAYLIYWWKRGRFQMTEDKKEQYALSIESKASVLNNENLSAALGIKDSERSTLNTDYMLVRQVDRSGSITTQRYDMEDLTPSQRRGMETGVLKFVNGELVSAFNPKFWIPSQYLNPYSSTENINNASGEQNVFFD